MIDLRDLNPGAVPLDMVRRYLVATGWRLRGSKPHSARSDDAVSRVLLDGRTGGKRNFDVFLSSQQDFEGVELIVPNSVETSEYPQLMARVVNALAALEDRDEAEIVRSFREIAFDVVRSRIPDAHVINDAIKLEVARSFVVGIRSVLAAAATTEIQPTAYFLRLKKEAAEYADRCRFGHTFRGSFGFTVESPLQKNDQLQLLDIDPPPPFERRVIHRISRGLKSVNAAVSADSITPITSSTDQGFSANVCELLASLVEQTSQGGIAFDFSFSPEWPSRDLPPNSRESFFIGPAQVEVIKAAAKELRSQVQSWQETVYGRVIRLATDANPSDLTDLMGDREIAILWSSEDLGDITVRCSLSPADYLTAVEAHAAGRPVEVSGTLERRARRWVLLDPTGFA